MHTEQAKRLGWKAAYRWAREKRLIRMGQGMGQGDAPWTKTKARAGTRDKTECVVEVWG